MTPLRLSLATVAAGILSLSARLFHTEFTPLRAISTHRIVLAPLTPTATPMLDPRSDHSATLLPDELFSSPAACAAIRIFHRSAEIFDPTNNQFHQRRRYVHLLVSVTAAILLLFR